MRPPSAPSPVQISARVTVPRKVTSPTIAWSSVTPPCADRPEVTANSRIANRPSTPPTRSPQIAPATAPTDSVRASADNLTRALTGSGRSAATTSVMATLKRRSDYPGSSSSGVGRAPSALQDRCARDAEQPIEQPKYRLPMDEGTSRRTSVRRGNYILDFLLATRNAQLTG